MTESDQIRWNRRYEGGAYADRPHPGDFLKANIEDLPVGKALDLACGRGRNSLFLADRGFDVEGIDVSDIALDQAQNSAEERNLKIRWVCQDLSDNPDLPPGPYSLIIMFRFVADHLLPQLSRRLVHGGHVMVEEHLRWPDENLELAGPKSERFRIAPGMLRQWVEEDPDLEVVVHTEGLVTEPDGTKAAVSRMLARRIER